MNGKELLSDMSYVHSKYVQEADGKLPEKQRKPIHFRKKPLLVAAIITTAAILMGAAIDALISMRVEPVAVHIPVQETQVNENGDTEQTWIDDWYEGEQVNFDEAVDVFIELGPYYPHEIPEGYTMTFISDGAPLQNQTIQYEDDSGNYISYWIYIADSSSSVEVYDIVKKTKVDINGEDGILYVHGDNSQTVVWIDREKGFGFALKANNRDVDLLKMAKSTAEGEPLVPTRAEDTQIAIEQLGDFSPTYLPDGFEEQGVQASPLYDVDDWYSYVRKWYVNKIENTRIYFEYETYAIATEDGYTDDAKTICSYFIPGYDRGVAVYEEVEINGMFGLSTENHIVWADPTVHKVFHLTSEDITGDELLKIAKSIQEE